MNKVRKVDLLYRKANGQGSDATPDELKELRKYKVDRGEGAFFATKKNITAYVDAVDKKGCKISFYDWCMNNHRADKRRSGSSDAEMSRVNLEQGIGGVLFLGWVTWGIAIYWVFGGEMGIGPCIIVGMVISFIMSRIARKWALFTMFVLPCLIAVFTYK